MIGLYVHIPFCKSKCPYCDFYSITLSETTAFAYMQAVIRNLDFYNERYDSVYFGGGTPSLCCWHVCHILGKIRSSDDAEITVEVNPGTVNTQNFVMLRDSGVNRLSFGVQSFANNELVTLGRRHTAEDANNMINLAHDNGFNNISVDLMLGIPKQTPESVKRSIKVISSLNVTHVSAYILKIEENTPFANANIVLPDDEKIEELYITAVDALENCGIKQYEISNFAKPGFECKHNLKYWESGEYLGIGAAAHSYYNGERFEVPKDIASFIKSDIQPVQITDDKPHTFEEYAMLKLRLTKGLSFDECKKFNVKRDTMLARAALIPPKYLNIDTSKISITKSGFLLSNQIISKLIYG